MTFCKKMNQATRYECAKVIDAFEEGTCGELDWDDLIRRAAGRSVLCRGLGVVVGEVFAGGGASRVT